MQLIPANLYRHAAPLFEAIPHQRPAVFAVLEGTVSGQVYLDDPQHPRAALILSDYPYIGGLPASRDAVQGVVHILLREILANREHILLFPLNQPWQEALQAELAEYQPRIYLRSRFLFDAALYHQRHDGWQKRVPAGFHVERVDSRTVGALDGIQDLWGSLDAFLARGFGYCVVDENSIPPSVAADAHAVFAGGGAVEIGVGTQEAYRRRGLATAASCAFIDHCLEHGLYAEWTCMYNEPSERLAYHMGYTTKQDVPFIYLHMSEEQRKALNEKAS